MVTRAVAAGRLLTPLAILVPILATVAGACLRRRLLVFLALGSLGVRTYRVISIMPLALLSAALSMLLVFALAPGTPGICET
jgi:hypothetical protein